MVRRSARSRPALRAPVPNPHAADRRILAIVNWAVQIVIAVFGAIWVIGDGDLLLLMAWCALGTLYVIALITTLTVLAHGRARPIAASGREPRWFERLQDVVTVVLTIVPAAIGVTAAITVIVFGKASGAKSITEPGDDIELTAQVIKVIGVWAMLLAWVMLHWGFAQIYAHRTASAMPRAVLEFPGTAEPSLVDHVYFAFAIGTTFAASDVNVLTTRTRWLVTIHSVLGFFLNALIIVLSFNTILGAAS